MHSKRDDYLDKAEECDYLNGIYGGEDFAEHVEAESEQRPGSAAMFFDGNGMQARHGDAGLDGERHGESHEREQGGELVRVGEMRGFKGEAFGLEIAEHGLDGPSLPIACQRMARTAGAGERQEFARGEPHRRGARLVAAAELA